MAGDIIRLEELLQRREWSNALLLCEDLLLECGSSLADLVYVNHAVCRARRGLGDHYGAIPPGQLAIRLGKDAKMWGEVKALLQVVGESQVFTRQYEQALATLFEYFEFQNLYAGEALTDEGDVWLTLAAAYEGQGDSRQAIWALERARGSAMIRKDEALLFRCSNALVRNACAQNPADAVRWLRESLRFARSHPANRNAAARYLLHKAIYLLARQDYRRCAGYCRWGMRLDPLDPELQFHLQVLLAKVQGGIQDFSLALDTATAARTLAVQIKRWDLEYQAAQVVHDLLQSRGSDSLQGMDPEFLLAGLDLGLDVSDLFVSDKRLPPS